MEPPKPGTKWVSPSGRVALLAPSGSSPYYRLTWRDANGKRRQTHVGRELEPAKAKARDKERVLTSADDGVIAARRVGDLLDFYIDPKRPKFEKNRPGRSRFWSTGYTTNVERRLAVVRDHVGHLRLEELTQRHISDVVNGCATFGQAQAMRTTCRGFVRLGLRKGLLRPEQHHIADVDVLVDTEPRAERLTRQLEEGENVLLIADWEVPSNQNVHALAHANVRYELWEGLVNVLAYVGPRVHEGLALTADDVVPVTKAAVKNGQTENYLVLAVTKQLVEPKGGGVHLTPPKNGRTRRVTVPRHTPCGFPLADWLRQRAAQARAEREAGTNPLALLFPSPRARTYWRLNNLHHRVFVPAAAGAAWEYDLFEAKAYYYKDGKLVVRDAVQRVWRHPLHSLRHRFATTARDDWGWRGEVLCRAGGWASEEFVIKRYYATTQEVLDKAARSQAKAVAKARQKAAERPVRVEADRGGDRSAASALPDDGPPAGAESRADASVTLGCSHA